MFLISSVALALAVVAAFAAFAMIATGNRLVSLDAQCKTAYAGIGSTNRARQLASCR